MIKVNADVLEVVSRVVGLSRTERRILRAYAEYQKYLNQLKKVGIRVNIYHPEVNELIRQDLQLEEGYYFKPYIIKFKKLNLFVRDVDVFKVDERIQDNDNKNEVTFICQRRGSETPSSDI